MNKKVSTIIWILAICAILIAAYTFYNKNKKQSPLTPSNQNERISQGTQDKNPVAPDFSLKDLNGRTVKLSDYRGKIVFLNFWYANCSYCVEEMPDFNDFNKGLGEDSEAVVLMVNFRDSKNTVENFMSNYKLDLKVLLDQDGLVSQKYGVKGFPTTFVLNKDGTLYTYITGATNKETLTGILDSIKKGGLN